MTFDWTANAANGWTIPAGADVGRAYDLGVRGMSWQVDAFGEETRRARWSGCYAFSNRAVPHRW